MNKLYKLYARIFSKPIFEKWNLRLLRFALSGLGILNYYNNKLSGEGHFIEKVLPKYIKGRPVFFDVGANVGNYSKLLATEFPNSILHLFEPHPKNFQKLGTKEFTEQVFLNNLAVSEEQGALEIFDYKYNDGSSHASVYKGVIEDIHKGESVSHKVKKITLDDYIIEKSITEISLLKIDVEGHELQVLKGASKAIYDGSIKIIHFEFNEMNVESRTFLKDIISLLDEYNFYRLLPNSLLPLNNYRALTYELFAYQNVAAIRKDIDKENNKI